MNSPLEIIIYLVYIIFIVISVVLHEFAHGFVSYKLGDPTPKIAGRLSLNPLNHINKHGFVLLIILFGLQILGYSGIGMTTLGIFVAILFAKPVLINPSYYKNPLKGDLLVALAGPFTNFLLAIFGMLLTLFIGSLIGYDQQPMDFDGTIIFFLLKTFITLNITLGAFNLLPIPPLDGFSIITYLFPNIAHKYGHIIYHGTFPLIFVVILLGPGGFLVDKYLNFVEGIFDLFYTALASIFF